MSSGPKFSSGAFNRLAAAGAAGYVGAAATGAQPLEAAIAGFASMATNYLASRAIEAEATDEENARAARNHHLQLLIASAIRLALADIAKERPIHPEAFADWDTILQKAIHDPAFLGVVIPAEFGPLLDTANPHLDRGAASAEGERVLGFLLATQRAGYPVASPPPLTEELQRVLAEKFLPTFERNFGNLLVHNDETYARRAFERRHLQEILARVRRIDDRDLLQLAAPALAQPFDRADELKVLRAENRAIPMIGRESDVARLWDWLRSGTPVSCRILTGIAGTGKTRLGIRLIEEAAAAGWHAGFLRQFPQDLNSRRWDRPTLAVVWPPY